MSWQNEYKKKFVSPEEAVKVVRSGDTVVIPADCEPQALSTALMNRKDELQNVRVLIREPRYDLGWLRGDFGNAFDVVLDTHPGGVGAKAMRESGVGFIPILYGLRFKRAHDTRREAENIEVIMIVVSPPDNNGFCSFGLYLGHKRDYIKRAKTVLAEVSDTPAMRVRVPGSNYIHVSDIDNFVEHIPVPVQLPQRRPDQLSKQIAEYVSTIVRDGDTVQLGIGLPSFLPSLGAFDGKHDLGIHSPVISLELLELVRRGIVTGKHKNLHPDKCVSTGFRGVQTKEDIALIYGNPMFEVYDTSYVNDIRVIASNDRMAAINGILGIDLSGQIAADTIGMHMLGGAGGQVDFAIGATLSKGGCSIAVLRSTTSKGNASRIVPTFETGTIVTIPWTFTDYVVTEYGIAKLLGKSRKHRAEELIAIAHPDFRAELAKQAQRLF
ncbi:acetyl-CoA hydrolase/transferase family protein [Chloroflexota bacterium]